MTTGVQLPSKLSTPIDISLRNNDEVAALESPFGFYEVSERECRFTLVLLPNQNTPEFVSVCFPGQWETD